MYFIEVYNKTNGNSWKEEFDSYYKFRKRVIKLKHSDKLTMIYRSLLEEEMY